MHTIVVSRARPQLHVRLLYSLGLTVIIWLIAMGAVTGVRARGLMGVIYILMEGGGWGIRLGMGRVGSCLIMGVAIRCLIAFYAIPEACC